MIVRVNKDTQWDRIGYSFELPASDSATLPVKPMENRLDHH